MDENRNRNIEKAKRIEFRRSHQRKVPEDDVAITENVMFSTIVVFHDFPIHIFSRKCLLCEFDLDFMW